MDDFVICRAKTKHLPGLLECLSRFGCALPEIWMGAALLKSRDENGIRTYVAVSGGKVLGTASLVLERKLIYGGGVAARIEEVAVLAGEDGKGVGSALVEHCLAEAAVSAAYKATLGCKREKAGFYGKLGFSEAGVEMRRDL